MSTCISPDGEYSSHQLDADYICQRCSVLDEDAIIDALHRVQAQRDLLVPMQRMLMDLDRSPNGRHQGDAEGQDPSGTSQGNPHLTTGQIIGHDIGGRPYVVPEPHLRGVASAWQASRPVSPDLGTTEPKAKD